MPLTIVRGEENAPLAPLTDKTVAVLGYGNQGHAHALNLRDSGVRVVVANRPDSLNGKLALVHGFSPMPIEEAVVEADLIIMALPDEAQPAVFERSIAPHLKAGSVLGFLHGFNIRFERLRLDPSRDLGVIMVAPKGPGRTLRQAYQDGRGIPCLFALHQDTKRKNTRALGLAWANGIGCARAGIIFTSIADETDTDLFGEQAVLCGGITHLILAAFETLVRAGYPPELAYLECCHEVKQIADLVYERGLAAMMQAISNTAEFGAHQAGPILIDESVRQRMQRLLDQVRDGSFARDLVDDFERGFPRLERERKKLREHAIEEVGRVIRSLTATDGGRV